MRKMGDAMIRKTMFTAMVMALAAVSATAQDKRVELSATFGYTFSDGVTGNAVKIGTLGTFSKIDPLNAMSWGARVGFLLSDNNEVGFLFNQQSTELDLGGTASLKIADLAVRNYHGYFAYNFGDTDLIARPYVLIGLGATQYSPSGVNVAGTTRQVSGNSKFSGTGAIGLKIHPGDNKNFAIRLEGRWTPTYIKSDATGWWCDPYWGCYVTENAQYSNQFELSGGLTIRF
jgi:hypothetical protein